MRRSIRNKLLVGEGDKYELLAELAEGCDFDYYSVSDCVLGSGEMLSACVVSSDGPIGIDVQGGAARPRIVERYFSDGERDLPFALVWARKEAYAKWLGTGLTHESLAVDTCGLEFEEYDLGRYGWPGCYLAVYPAMVPPPRQSSPE